MRTYIKDNASRVGFVAFVALAIAGCSGEDLTGGDEPDQGGAVAPDDVSGEAAVSSDASALVLDEPSLSDVYIKEIRTGGSGCPDHDDVTTSIALDRKSFTVTFDKMQLDYPPPPPVKNLNCNASIILNIPSGLQVSIATVNTSGYAFIPRGGKARQISSYFFSGQQLRRDPHTDIVGPYDDTYLFTDEVPFVSWTECRTQAIFNVNTQLNLNMLGARNGTAVFNTQEVDGKFKKVFHLMWRYC